MVGPLMNGVRAIAALGMLCAAAACGGSGDSGTEEAAASPVIAVGDWNGYLTSEISGRLRLVDGCLLVGDEFTGGGGHYTKHGLDGLEGLDVDSVITCMNRTDSVDAVIATPLN